MIEGIPEELKESINKMGSDLKSLMKMPYDLLKQMPEGKEKNELKAKVDKEIREVKSMIKKNSL